MKLSTWRADIGDLFDVRKLGYTGRLAQVRDERGVMYWTSTRERSAACMLQRFASQASFVATRDNKDLLGRIFSADGRVVSESGIRLPVKEPA